ncbi:ABC transporter substrate-binding protein [Variovorax sp. PBL-E5]|uniref:ABC transporter substrate-binding protein n=1 Tax=Variovorax sp. PBL-E5 TaxID=434014 RepID=UPI0013A5770B|nr:ABC transporter substrate-binding protein [Variovorax sp. PBL-E5]
MNASPPECLRHSRRGEAKKNKQVPNASLVNGVDSPTLVRLAGRNDSTQKETMVKILSWLRLVAVSCLALILGGAGFAAFAADGVIKVGGLFGTTGPQANFGVPYSEGLKLAASEINAKGGVKVGDRTYTISVVLADTKSDPAQAIAEAQRMAADGVRIFFCCNLSAEAVPVLNAALPQGAIMVSPNAAVTKLLGTPGKDLLFKAGNIEVGDDGSTAMWVPFVLEKAKPKTAAIMVPSDEAGQIYADAYRQTLEAKGVKVVAVERYDHGATDFSPQLTKIRERKPDVLFAGYSDEVRGIFRQAGELGVDAMYAGTVGVSGAAGEGLPAFAYPAWTRFLDKGQSDRRVLAYMAALEKSAGKLTPNSFWSITQYDWLNMIISGMQKAGTTTDLGAVAKVLKGQRYAGLVDWSVDDKGLGRQSMEGVYLAGGQVKEVRSIKLPGH